MTRGTQDRTSIPVSTPSPLASLVPPLSLSLSVPLVPLSFLPSTWLGLELFAQYTPFPSPPSSLHFRVSVGANAAFNSGIILLLALQILSL